jgi:hypothetical protein
MQTELEDVVMAVTRGQSSPNKRGTLEVMCFDVTRMGIIRKIALRDWLI